MRGEVFGVKPPRRRLGEALGDIRPIGVPIENPCLAVSVMAKFRVLGLPVSTFSLSSNVEISIIEGYFLDCILMAVELRLFASCSFCSAFACARFNGASFSFVCGRLPLKMLMLTWESRSLGGDKLITIYFFFFVF